MDVFSTGFLKKSIAAVTLVAVVMLTMCPSASESAPQHRHRHHRQVIEKTPFKKATEDFIITLRNHHTNYTKELIKYKNISQIPKKECQGKPAWMPKFNSLEIHFHQSKSLKGRFKYITPLIFKNFMEYKILFSLLKNVTISAGSDLFVEKTKRMMFIDKALVKLNVLLYDHIGQQLHETKLPTPKVEIEDLNLQTFKMRVGHAQYDFQDKYVFKGYENLLRFWKLELRCWHKITPKKRNRNCKRFLDEMEFKRKKKCEKHPKTSLLCSNISRTEQVSNV